MKKLIILLFVLLISPEAFSWGKNGHRIVGEIAQRNLSKQALAGLKAILGNDDLSRVSTWADEIKSNKAYDYASPWHYVSIPTGKNYLEQKRVQEGDLIESLFRFEETLNNSKISTDIKKESLKFLTHMMGDLHQPLHVGITEDRGGNSIRLKWFKTDTNLHSIWDESIIDFEQLSYSEYASYLNHFTPEEKKTYISGNFIDWAKESQQLRGTVYDIGTTGSIGYDYHYKIKPIMELRLRQAGLRLAHLLNRVFEKKALTKEYINLREKIKENI